MERINKATLFVNLLFFVPKKEEIYKNRLRLGVALFILGIYLCVQIKKGLVKIIPLKNKTLDWVLLLRSSRHLWNKSLTSWQMHCF